MGYEGPLEGPRESAYDVERRGLEFEWSLGYRKRSSYSLTLR